MKYLNRFNESWKTERYKNISDIRNNCEEILLELNDKGIEYQVYGFEGTDTGEGLSKDLIRIEIGNERDNVKLKEFELELEHLLSYLKEEGFKLSKSSYYMNDSWDPYECCPRCESNSVSPPDNLQSMEGWSCNKCNHLGHQEDFQKFEHPVNEEDLIWSIKNNYYVQIMSLTFTR